MKPARLGVRTGVDRHLVRGIAKSRRERKAWQGNYFNNSQCSKCVQVGRGAQLPRLGMPDHEENVSEVDFQLWRLASQIQTLRDTLISQLDSCAPTPPYVNTIYSTHTLIMKWRILKQACGERK